MFRERMRRRNNDIGRKSQEIVPPTCWGKLTSFQIALVSIIIIELFFLMSSFAIYGAFSFPWSPWTASGKCSDLCTCAHSREAFRRENGLDADEGWVDNEKWAEIPEELHLFLIYRPDFFNGDKEDNDNTGKQTTSNEETTITSTIITTPITTTPITTTPITTRPTTTTPTTTTPTTTTPSTTTTEMPIDRFCGDPPVMAIMYMLYSPYTEERLFDYKCSAAVVSPAMYLVNSDCVGLPLEGKIRGGYQYSYTVHSLGYPGLSDVKRERTRVVKFVTFKKLGAVYFYRPLNPYFMPPNGPALPLRHEVKVDKACTYVWAPTRRVPYKKMIDKDRQRIKTIVYLTGKRVPSSISAPLIFYNQTDERPYLLGFASKGQLVLNIYVGEYKNWLSKL